MELRRLVASSVDRSIEDIASFGKFGEGRFSRTFSVIFRDGFQLVARIPYHSAEPKQLVVTSEVATAEFLRLNDIPVPKIYGYYTISDNPAGTEYIFMGLVQGTNLDKVWDNLGEQASCGTGRPVV